LIKMVAQRSALALVAQPWRPAAPPRPQLGNKKAAAPKDDGFDVLTADQVSR